MQQLKKLLCGNMEVSLAGPAIILFVFTGISLFIQHKKLLQETNNRLLDTEKEAFFAGSIAQMVAVYIALIYSVLNSVGITGIIFFQFASILYLSYLQNKRTSGIVQELSDISGAVLFINITGHYFIPLIIYSVLLAYNSYNEKYGSDERYQCRQFHEKKLICIINLIETFLVTMLIDFMTPVDFQSLIYFYTTLIVVFYLVLPHCNNRIKDLIIESTF